MKALDEIEYALSMPGANRHCPQIYLLRAEAYKQLRYFDNALADERHAATLKNTYCEAQ